MVLSRRRSHGINKMVQEREKICKTIESLKLIGNIRVMGQRWFGFYLYLWEIMIFNTIPKISCIKIAESKEDVVGFFNQRYPNKELVVFGDKSWKFPEGVLVIEPPSNLTLNEKKDLLIELTTGDFIYWWQNQEDEFWLTKRFKKWNFDKQDDECFFSKLKFYKSGNMFYSGEEMEVLFDYW